MFTKNTTYEVYFKSVLGDLCPEMEEPDDILKDEELEEFFIGKMVGLIEEAWAARRPGGVALAPLAEYPSWLESARALHEKQPVTCARGGDASFLTVLQSWRAEPYAVLQDGMFAGYCALAEGKPPRLQELVLPGLELLPELLQVLPELLLVLLLLQRLPQRLLHMLFHLL